MGTPTFEELCALEPRLWELEKRISEVRDPGTGSFFCSNFVWLPLNADLKDLVGVARRKESGSPELELNPEEERQLRSSFSYEVAYLRLSVLMPPCRDCGCREFEPYQLAQIEDAERN